MKRKKTDTVQLSKVRIREELRAKLVRDAEKNAKTLNGEIVDRLEASYEQADRWNSLREAARAEREKFWSERENVFKEREAELEKAKAELEKAKALLNVQTERIEHIQRLQDRLQGAEDTLNVLLGKDKQKSELLRRIVIEMASWPEDWATNASLRSGIRERFVSTMAQQKVGGTQ
jgi:hypothetical protein